ncbi:MAG: exodeoxyribonuclease V subunit gamma [Chromatiales bacterium]|nr:exodeoxyribonuclease V subunit gamma [Chromatiales bacterium]
MLHLFQSNRLESLADRLAALMRAEPLGPFSQEQVVVQHPGMGRWLSLQLADRLGICSNVEFPLPAGFIWQVLGQWLSDVPQTNSYDPKLMVWRVLALLQALRDQPAFAPVARYLDSQDEFGQYELAEQVTRCLDAYLVYRPDWIARWQQGQSVIAGDEWQASLWRQLAAQSDSEHWVALQQRLFSSHSRGELDGELLPPRVVFFGLVALSPGYLSIVELLAHYTNVHLLLLNPCQAYWLDIQDQAEVSRRVLESSSDEALYLEVGNPLLASWGKQGRDFFAQIQSFDPGSAEDFRAPDRTTLLQAVQQDILDLVEPAGDFVLRDQDDSLQIHSCHSPMREVEVLHDQLLGLFDRHPDLNPDDVLVMTPDMDAYAPYIEAVFAETGEGRRIPFAIADRNTLSGKGVSEAFLQLLTLPTTRYENNRLLALLEEPAVARCFGLTADDLPQITAWIEQAAIRWGRDGAMRAGLELPETDQNSWRFGLDRLLLGYALPGSGEHLFEGLLPVDDVEGSAGALMGSLSAFIEAVFALESQLAGQKSLGEWSELLLHLLGRFFVADDQEVQELQQLRELLGEMAGLASEAAGNVRVSIELVRPWLRRQLEGISGQRRFLGGGTTFCALTPMRSLPFKVICLIGMNDGAFPREQRPAGFDLLGRDHRLGDRSRRADDRYLFLETLASARQCFYISYTGQDLRDNSTIPPSTLVSELIDYIKQIVTVETASKMEESIVTTHPLQPFNPHYFDPNHRLFSYSSVMAAAAQTLSSSVSRPAVFFSGEKLSVPDEVWRQVELPQLLGFFDNPVRFLLRHRLGIQLDSTAGELDSRDPIHLDYFEAADLQLEMIDHLLAGEGTVDLLERTRAAGELAHGQYGEHYFAGLAGEAEDFVAGLDDTGVDEFGESLDVDLTIGAFRLAGKLENVKPDGLVYYSINRLPARDQLRLWIRHLLLNLVAPNGVASASRCYHADQHWRFGPLADAEAQLGQLLELYWQGLSEPLHLFPKSALAYAEALHGGKEREQCMSQAWNAWNGQFTNYPESANAYYRFAFRDLNVLDGQFEALSEQVFGPFLAIREVL